MRSILKKSLGFLHRILGTLTWVVEYRKTVCHSGAYILLIRKAKKMSDEWIYEIVPADQINSINKNADKTIKNMSGGVSIVLGTDNQSAVDLCQTWGRALNGDPTAWIRISSFMSGIIETIEEHLLEENINPYDVED